MSINIIKEIANRIFDTYTQEDNLFIDVVQDTPKITTTPILEWDSKTKTYQDSGKFRKSQNKRYVLRVIARNEITGEDTILFVSNPYESLNNQSWWTRDIVEIIDELYKCSGKPLIEQDV